MNAFRFSSLLPEEYRDDLENLLYFNPLQPRARGAILAAVEKYGPPRILTQDGFLRPSIETVPDVQTLYAFAEFQDGDQLAGIVLFNREGQDLVILHIAVGQAYSSSASDGDALLVLRLLILVQQIARRVKGVHSVLFRNLSGGVCRLRLDKSSRVVTEPV